MSFKFRFRKFIAPSDYAACGISSAVPDIPAFSTNSEYSVYNELTGNGSLLSQWNNATVLYALATEEQAQDYFTRQWIEEDGVEVYIPSAKKLKPAKNDIEMLIYTQDKRALRSFVTLVRQLNEWGVFEYYDNYHKGLKRLVYEGFEMVKDMERDGMRVMHFKLKCNNILGYDNKNFNPSTGLPLWA